MHGFCVVWFQHQGNIFDWDFAGPPESAGNVAQRRLTEKHHMGRIATVMPCRETFVVRLETGHERQPSAGTQHPVETGELLGWPMEMFDGLGAGNEIVEIFEWFRIGEKKRVKQSHPVSCLAQHASKGRPGTTSIVKPLCLRRQPQQQWTGKL